MKNMIKIGYYSFIILAILFVSVICVACMTGCDPTAASSPSSASSTSPEVGPTPSPQPSIIKCTEYYNKLPFKAGQRLIIHVNTAMIALEGKYIGTERFSTDTDHYQAKLKIFYILIIEYDNRRFYIPMENINYIEVDKRDM